MNKVHEYLKTGRANAIPAEKLMQAFNVSRRGLYSEIHRERLEGAIILPDNAGGYYIPDLSTEEGQNEYENWRQRMQANGRGNFAVTKRQAIVWLKPERKKKRQASRNG